MFVNILVKKFEFGVDYFDDLYSIWSVNTSTIKSRIVLHGLGDPQFMQNTFWWVIELKKLIYDFF